MKVIFLDVDGVLNNEDWCATVWNECKVDVYARDILYQPALIRLKQIILQTGAKIVVSSAWRNIPSAYQHLKQQLDLWQIEIYDCTPSLTHDHGFERGDEIEQWLIDHPNVEEYVILDDDNDMGQLMDHLVQTLFIEGLSDEDAKKCVEMLGG